MWNGFESKFMREFTVTDILGEGGFGCVFEAENHYDECKYAVKRIAVVADNSTLDKALREVRALGQLDHPNIVRYNSTWIERPPTGWQYDADEEMLSDIQWWAKSMSPYDENSVFIYIQMQLCSYSLANWLHKTENRTASSRELSRMKKWFKQMVSAVEYIHDKGLIHRDLKPSNIMFVDEDRLKLCDLGIATERAIIGGEEISVPRTAIGTRMYMSPEQRAPKPVYCSKTDIFSLGLIFAELCVVMEPRDQSKFFQYCRRGKECDLIADPATDNFVRTLTQVDPEQRPTSKEILSHPFLA